MLIKTNVHGEKLRLNLMKANDWQINRIKGGIEYSNLTQWIYIMKSESGTFHIWIDTLPSVGNIEYIASQISADQAIKQMKRFGIDISHEKLINKE